jgi:hypothetical protein
VVELGSAVEHTLQPSSDGYGKLTAWAASNRSGWSSYYATPPAKGIIVRAGTFDVQFIETSVLAHTREGVFVKSVSPSEYSFLRP